jgi:hypothetical protein
MKALLVTEEYSQVGFQCFIDMKLINQKTVIRRKFIEKLPHCIYFQEGNRQHFRFDSSSISK